MFRLAIAARFVYRAVMFMLPCLRRIGVPALRLLATAFVPAAVFGFAAVQAQENPISGQYKRIHQEALRKVVNGRPAKAIEDLEKILDIAPTDGETHYMLAVARAALGDSESASAMASIRAALENGVPIDRFAEPSLTGLDGLSHLEDWRALHGQFDHRPVHGPMLGSLTDHGVRVWVRTAKPSSVQVIASIDRALSNPIRSEPVHSGPDTDMTAVASLTGLEPDTHYYYAVLIDGERDPAGGTHGFRTFTGVHRPAAFRLAFGGGAGFVPAHEMMWEVIRSKQPDLVLLLGDNVYIDDPESPAMQHYCYFRRQSRPEFRRLVASTPVYSIWDDHDFGTNDCSGGPALDTPWWKRPVYRVYRNNWANPAYGGGDANPGCYYDFYVGDVHFIMLDGRYYRNLKPDDAGMPTMLGPVQRRWLLETVRESRGTFKVICSPVPWVFKAKGDSRDTWNGFKEERTLLFDFLTAHQIDGVVLMSADRHRSDLWSIERPNDYKLFEFNSSRLTNQHVHPEMKDAVFSYNKKQSFGLVDFDTIRTDPTVTYRIVNIDGEIVHEFVLKRSALKP